MILENLTEDNFLLECAKHYRNKHCQSTDEFMSDLQHIKYIKKLLTRYLKKDILFERLILNHIIILNNVFGPQFLCRIIFLKLYPQITHIKPFLLYLNLLPEKVFAINGKDYDTISIELDWKIVEKLRLIDNNSKD
jgi:hypothetical protein